MNGHVKEDIIKNVWKWFKRATLELKFQEQNLRHEQNKLQNST